jgi:glycerophosphoryl diester phosphodiesterase
MKDKTIDWQGHRGARGLLPENTIPAFIKALDLDMNTLELDLAVSRDNVLIISHEPWLNRDICSKPDGSPISRADEEAFQIWKMTAAEISRCDCGSRGNPRFLTQQRMRAVKPSLADMVAAVKKYCDEKKRPLPNFNIEIKSRPDWDNHLAPSVSDFAALVLKEINRLGIRDKTCVQSFDPRALEALYQLDKDLTMAFLVENTEGVEKNLAKLSFKPAIYSPYFLLLTEPIVRDLHQRRMKVIPWTVNEAADMKRLIEMGVDGIITDYPDRRVK